MPRRLIVDKGLVIGCEPVSKLLSWRKTVGFRNRACFAGGLGSFDHFADLAVHVEREVRLLVVPRTG